MVEALKVLTIILSRKNTKSYKAQIGVQMYLHIHLTFRKASMEDCVPMLYSVSIKLRMSIHIQHIQYSVILITYNALYMLKSTSIHRTKHGQSMVQALSALAAAWGAGSRGTIRQAALHKSGLHK